MIVYPQAKINLGLNVLGRREDGYHNLSTVFYPINFCDILEITPTTTFKMSLSGLEIAGDDNNNLCLKAYELIKKDFNIDPVRIHLHKVIPMGAGLGGGSSDGTATLMALNNLFNLKISDIQLEKYALELGSDCPFFVKGIPAIATGRGEELEGVNVDLSGYKMVVVCSGLHISTAESFSSILQTTSADNLSEVIAKPLSSWNGEMVNDFEKGAVDLHPRLREIKNELYNQGAIYASMTGTGSAFYGVFAKEKKFDKSKFENEIVWEES